MTRPLRGEARELVRKINTAARKGKDEQAMAHISRLKIIPMSQIRILAELNEQARQLYTS